MDASKGTSPVTIERLERALDTMAEFMSQMGADAAVYLPIYERLERELEEMRRTQFKLAEIRERAKAVRSRTKRK